MACSKCKMPYPDEILAPVMINGVSTPDVCGICALELMNVHHGSKRTRFTEGSIAADFHERALKWRINNPQLSEKQ